MSVIDLTSMIKQEFIDQMPGHFVVMDLNSKFILGNKSALKASGFKSYDLGTNATYHDMRCSASELHDEFCRSDQMTIQRDGNLGILSYCNYADGWKIILGEKYPLHDSNGDIIAIAQYFNDVTHSRIIDISKIFKIKTLDDFIMSSKQQVNYILEENYPEISLPGKQSECLFYLIRGKSAKEIAKILNLSPRTVECHIEKVKLRFNCYKKSELIEKAIENGFINIIPKSLFEQIS